MILQTIKVNVGDKLTNFSEFRRITTVGKNWLIRSEGK